MLTTSSLNVTAETVEFAELITIEASPQPDMDAEIRIQNSDYNRRQGKLE